MTEKTDILIVGYGNIGKGVVGAIKQNPDTNLVGIVSRDPFRVAKNFRNNTIPIYYQQFILDIYGVAPADVAILCGGSKKDLPVQGPAFAELYNTVDSFDTHGHIGPYTDKKTGEWHRGYFADMQQASYENNHISIISAGWDPGTFSNIRIQADAFIPGCIPRAFYGLEKNGGLSMGHSDALRQIEEVKDARQYTHAIHETIDKIRKGENPNLTPREMHWRECFVVLKDDIPEKRNEVDKKIKTMEEYYAPYNTTVEFATQKRLDEIHQERGMAHDGIVLAVGRTNNGNKVSIEYKFKQESNPEATANILVANARAAHKLSLEGKGLIEKIKKTGVEDRELLDCVCSKYFGARTMSNITDAQMNLRSRKDLLKNFM